jgi:lysine 6-dehydrogenase
MSLLKHLGLMSSVPVKLKSGTIAPRELLSYVFAEKIPKDASDAVLLRVTVTGVKEKVPTQVVWECVEFGSEADNLSAMMRMTAFPASIIAQMIARGDISERGVLRQETSIPVKLFLAELNSRGIKLTMTEREPVTA